MKLFRHLCAWLLGPRFDRYHPARRIGTRRVERRLLRRLRLHFTRYHH